MARNSRPCTTPASFGTPPAFRRHEVAGGGQVDIEAWDVAVIGAGPAGSVCACSALATSPRLRVALVDMEAFPRDKACGDAIQVDAADLLRELGYGAVFDGRPLVSRAVRNFPAALSRFGAGEYLQSHYIIEREIFDNHLFSGALRQGAGDFSEHRFVDATFDAAAGLWRLTLTRRSGARMELRCAVLVGADGPSSRVRRLVGVERPRPAHNAVALRAYAQAEGLDMGAIRIDFLRSLLPGIRVDLPIGRTQGQHRSGRPDARVQARRPAPGILAARVPGASRR